MITPTKLVDIKYWVFDMDGTLTQHVHDFQMVRKILDIPAKADILSHLNLLPKEEAEAKHTWLTDYERLFARVSKPALGAVELVKYLKQQGCQLAILTRNNHELAHLTLKAIGLADYFDPEFILGRDEAAPKPAPDGLLSIAKMWGVAPHQAVMVGDYMYDMACGRNANTHTLLVNQSTNLWPELVDWHYQHCQAVLDELLLA